MAKIKRNSMISNGNKEKYWEKNKFMEHNRILFSWKTIHEYTQGHRWDGAK